MEAVKQSKTVRLRTFFLQYLLFLSMGTIVLVVAFLGLFTLAFSANIVLPANYAENEIEAFKDKLASGSPITPDSIPKLPDNAVFSQDGRLLYGNLSTAEALHARELIAQGKNRDSDFYTAAQHGEELWIFRYTLTPQYASPLLRSILPNPQLLGVLLFIIGILLQAALLAARFGRKLTGKLAGLQEATGNIRRENLEFTVEPSGIREIDDVLASLEQMKDALQTSLKQQWELERSRREQISALAHDIKTPLTIIRGNAELLQETSQDETQREYNGFILKSAEDIEAFVQEVIDLSSLQSSAVRQQSPVNLKNFAGELEHQLRALSTGKELSTGVRGDEDIPEWIRMDKELLQRGIINILANGVEHTPPQGSVTLLIRRDADYVHFTVTDTGRGFSPAELKEAAVQFYMGDQSRSSGSHHGMGLYIAESAAQHHGGTLTLENAGPSGGAKVTLSIPAAGDCSGHL
ncbi:sensor histidine kinase [Paenibacillus sp. PK3_47]|uniref:HAMP domain-containing sensor histidine kinase n=1 Tax=Paenibacillus sp. PK3_47 TaxID=2072642 RepID=UPI00201D95BF|nr:HAMP domain-containing sensor histidine kinase [Paenibacillus sp. PK3_47]UQZ35298.1 sensor histidine kinase [Paenibacillus sp. PK3_47]